MDFYELSLLDEMNNEAKRIEEEVLTKKELNSVRVTKEMDRKHFELIRQFDEIKAKKKLKASHMKRANDFTEEFAGEIAGDLTDIVGSSGDARRYLSREEREALELGQKLSEKRKLLHVPKKRRVWMSFVAVMILLLAFGITSVGSKSYWKDLWRRVVGDQKNTVINVEDMEIQESGDVALEAYSQIIDALGITPVYPRNIFAEMEIQAIEIDEKQKIAKVFYEINDRKILYAIYVNGMDSSYSERIEDELTDTFEVETQKQSVTVYEYLIKQTGEYRYVTNFEYDGIFYRIKGIIDRKEFEDLLKNLYYF
ncbi:MAG: DUF4367 domain-containing protein [Hespellia sp.]|nr:DUF4367 domain-containing protein [Hespellia sp.]